MSTLNRLAKFARLHPANQFLLVRAFLLVAAIRFGLWILPFRMVKKLVDRAALTSTRSHHAPPIQNITAAIQLVSRYIPAATCLTQALSAQILLTRAGHSPTLRIGVLRTDGRFKAHAWVECQGRIVIGEVAGIEDFTALPAL